MNFAYKEIGQRRPYINDVAWRALCLNVAKKIAFFTSRMRNAKTYPMWMGICIKPPRVRNPRENKNAKPVGIKKHFMIRPAIPV